MQRRISPHGWTPNSSRSRPLLPPLSAAVTIAVTSKSFNSLTRLSPASTRDWPAPPPMVTTFLLIAVCSSPLSRRRGPWCDRPSLAPPQALTGARYTAIHLCSQHTGYVYSCFADDRDA